MPTRVLLEGPAIEPLLAQVREEYGTHVKIISADKVRTGGIGGFFAKQKYELSVEVPDDVAPAPAPAAKPAGEQAEKPAETLEQLLARVESQDRYGDDDAFAEDKPPPFTPSPAFAAQASKVPPLVEPQLPPRTSMLSTNGAAFAEVMAGLGAHAPVAGMAPADNPAVRPFRPQTATGTPVNAVSAVPSDSGLSNGRRNPYLDDDLISDLTSTAATLLDASKAKAPPPPSAARPIVAPPVAAPARALEPPAPQRAAEAPQRAAEAPERAADRDPLVGSLVRLGLPENLAARIEGADAYSGVLQALADLPQAPEPPDRPGDVLVIAGELQHAVPVARRVVEQLGLDEQQLLLAGRSAAGTGIHASRRVDSPEEAERRARRMHRAEAAHVVVVDAPVSGLDASWVRDICDALGATAVWAVVDATRKTGDTSRHLGALGDVEAIVVHGVVDTADPASVLGLDLPIVSLDGEPATRRSWAALLCERMTADIDDDVPGRRRRRMRER